MRTPSVPWLCRRPTHGVGSSAIGFAMVLTRHMSLCEIAKMVWRSKTLTDEAFRKDYGDPTGRGLFFPLSALAPAKAPSAHNSAARRPSDEEHQG